MSRRRFGPCLCGDLACASCGPLLADIAALDAAYASADVDGVEPPPNEPWPEDEMELLTKAALSRGQP